MSSLGIEISHGHEVLLASGLKSGLRIGSRINDRRTVPARLGVLWADGPCFGRNVPRP